MELEQDAGGMELGQDSTMDVTADMSVQDIDNFDQF